MNYFYQNLKNNIDFCLRTFFVFSRKNYVEKNESKDDLFQKENLLQKEKELFDKYDLNYIKTNTTKKNYLENLYTIETFDKYLKVDSKDQISVLDVGCKNWFYAKAEYFFFKKYCEKLVLDGIEVDTNRLYTNFYSRGEVAKFHINNLENTNYIEGDFLNHNNKYDYIIWILPFVFEYTLLVWGLPKKYFSPKKMLAHAYDSLNKGGKIFIINQDEEEFNVQKELCDGLNIKYQSSSQIESDLLEDEDQRYFVVIQKED